MSSHSLDVLGRLEPRLSAALIERAAAWDPGSVAAPRTAASVILLRDARLSGIETYLLHRHARMRFAASMVVFPGGGLDPDDERWPDPIRRCAVRETQEETGVVLDPARLRPWAHWVTPEFEPRRYDTHFFVAELPVTQRARDLSGETDRAEWTSPAAALAAQRDGRIALMPPTLSILLELADSGSIAEIRRLAEGRVVSKVLPELQRTDDGWRFVYPRRSR
jgi:8-oxo-dGTP pyrophosphatase MutT (NUDIX family)